MALPDCKTDICNMALGRIGHKQTTEALITADPCIDPTAIQCNLLYEQTRDALLRSYWWRFAGERIDLAVVTNGDFAHWTSDDPDDWTATEAGTDDVSQVGAGEGYGGTGTKKCNIYSAADGTGVQIAQTITTVVGLEYKFSINIDTITAGELAVENLPEPTDGDTDWDSTGVKTVTFTADATSFSLVIKGYTAAATDITFDSISVVVVPEFEWSYGYTLPSDFLAMRSIWGENQSKENTIYSYALEGDLLLSNENSMKIRYTKREVTVNNFDPLFIEVLVLSLAVKLCMAIGQDDKMYRDLREELYGRKGLMSRVRAMDKQEQNTKGIYDHNTWLAAFRTSRDPTKLGSA